MEGDIMNSKDHNKLIRVSKEKNRKKRLKELVELYKENPDDKLAVINLVKTLGDFTEYRARAKELMELIASQNNYVNNYFYLGKMYLKDKEYAKARNAFLKGLEIEPNNLSLLFELGKVERKMHNYDEASTRFLKILDFGYDKGATLELGKLCIDKGDYKRAKSLFKAVLERNENQEAFYELGVIALIEKNFPLAEEYFLKALETFKKNNNNKSYILNKNFKKKVNLELYKLEFERGNILKARRYLMEILENSKDSRFLAELAKTYKYTNDYEIAKDILNSINPQEKDDIIYRELAKLETKCGNYDKAKEYFSKQDIKSANAKTILDLVSLYLKIDDIENALYLYFKFLEKYDKSSKLLKRSSIRRIETYLKYRLGILKEDSPLLSYQYARQLLCYNVNETINTSREHFSEDIDINNLLENVKSKLTQDNLTLVRDASDIYQMELKEPLHDLNNRDIKYLEVATIINTDKILSVYPIKEDSLLKNDIPKISISKTRVRN